MAGYSYSNTNGSGNRTGTITVTTNATLGGSSGTIDKLVNGNTTTDNNSNSVWFNGGAGDSGKFIKFDFGSSVVIKQSRWYQDVATNFTAAGQWAGSNDDSSYTNIGGTTKLGGKAAGSQGDTTLIANTTAYRYYRFTLGTTSSSPWVREVEFYIAGSTADEPDTSYLFSLSGGTNSTTGGATCPLNGDGVDRTGSITVTCSDSGSGGTLSNLVDGGVGNNSTDSFAFSNGLTNVVLKFAFATGVRIDGITWEAQTSANEGTYTLAGSNDDSSYTTIATGFQPVNGASFTEQNNLTNLLAYKYYRLTQTGGTTNSSPWEHEVMFKLAPAQVPTELDIAATTHTVGVNMAAVLDTPIATVAATVGVLMAAAVTTRKASGTIVIVCT